MSYRIKHRLLHYFIAAVWVANGFFCKILNLVPRHQQIVGEILGTKHSFILTKTIGLAEILLAVWLLSSFKSRLNAVTQILLVLAMNITELLLVPDLLLFGKWNFFFALIFIVVIYYNEFVLKTKVSINK